jgi:hypothetical protein
MMYNNFLILIFLLASSCAVNSPTERTGALVFPNLGFDGPKDDYYFIVKNGESFKTYNRNFTPGANKYNFGPSRILEHLRHRSTWNLNGPADPEEVDLDTVKSFRVDEYLEIIEEGRFTYFGMYFVLPSRYDNSVFFASNYNYVDSMFYRDSVFSFIFDFNKNSFIPFAKNGRDLYSYERFFAHGTWLGLRPIEYYSPKRIIVILKGRLYSCDALDNKLDLLYENAQAEVLDFVLWDEDAVLILQRQNNLYSFILVGVEEEAKEIYTTEEKAHSIAAVLPRQGRFIFKTINEYDHEGTVPQLLAELSIYDLNTKEKSILFGYQEYSSFLPEGDIHWQNHYWERLAHQAFSRDNCQLSANGEQLFLTTGFPGVIKIDLSTRESKLVVPKEFSTSPQIIPLQHNVELE